MESGASQRTSSLNKNAATEGTVGWLETSNLGSLTNQQDMKLDWPNVEPREEREN